MDVAKRMSECNQVKLDVETMASELRVTIDRALLDLDGNQKKLQDLGMKFSEADGKNMIANLQQEIFKLHFAVAKMSSALDMR